VKPIHRMASVMAAAVVAACASAPSMKPGATPSPVPEAQLPFEELPTHTILPGQCALVLWTRASRPRRIFLALNEPASAYIRTAGHTLALARTRAVGDAVFGHAPSQTYSGDGWTVEISFVMDPNSPLAGGATLSSALVSFTDKQGWSGAVPAAGMVACQN
jgi:hypothetical protein